MLDPPSPDLSMMDVEQSSGLDGGSEVSLEPETDRFGFLVTNGSTARSTGPPPELVRQREAKWINIISHWDYMLMKRSSKVRLQCQKGIPGSLRAKCWPLLCGATEQIKQNHTVYKILDSQPGSESWVDVIKRDLDRQFPFHEMFLSKDGHGQRGLFQVLKAYTQYRPEEGYCQAQGPVAAVLLMNMPAEEAFWCLVQISQQYLPGYYSPLLEGILFDAAMLTWLLKKTCPSAHKHLECYNVEPLMFATDWLMCLFARHLPFNTLLRVWDLFFYYGAQVLLQVSVVLVRRVLGRPEQRKECQGQMETLERLRGIRDFIREEEDTFITEVCSVPLSAKDMEKQTNREYEKWRRDKPSSNFDPRSRCQGYQLARIQRDQEEREKTNPSVSLSRSVSTLSLPPALLYSRWRKTGNTNKLQEGKKVARHLSMRVLEDSRSDLDFEKMERDPGERNHTWQEIKHSRQTQQKKVNDEVIQKSALTVQTAESALVDEQGGGAEKRCNEEYAETEETAAKQTEVITTNPIKDFITEECRDGETTSQLGVIIKHNEECKDKESDVGDMSEVSEKQIVVNEGDLQNKDRQTPYGTEVSSKEQNVQTDIKLEMENVQKMQMDSAKEASEKNLDSKTITNAKTSLSSSVGDQIPSTTKKTQINQNKGITERATEACEIKYHSTTESLVELEKTKESHDQTTTETGSLAPTQEKMEENAATQDEQKNELEQTNTEKKAGEETPMSSPECIERHEENQLQADPKIEAKKSSVKKEGNRKISLTLNSDEQVGSNVCNKMPSETQENVPESSSHQHSVTSTHLMSHPPSGEIIQVKGDSCQFLKDHLESPAILHEPPSGYHSTLSSGDVRVCRSSSFLGSRLARQLSEDPFTSTQKTGQSQVTCNHTNSQSSEESVNQTQTATVKTSEDTVVQEKLQSTSSKRFGHFLRGLKPKTSRTKTNPKMKIPIILFQDYSDVAESQQVDKEEETLNFRERRRWQKEQQIREKEEEKPKKKKEKEVRKEERERKKPQTKGKSFQEQKKKESTSVHYAKSGSQTLRYSPSHAESYF